MSQNPPEGSFVLMEERSKVTTDASVGCDLSFVSEWLAVVVNNGGHVTKQEVDTQQRR